MASKKQKSVPYEIGLHKRLRDPEYAADYLNALIEDGDEYFLHGLRDVAKAFGFSEMAAQSKLGRESLYKSLSKKGNPKFNTLTAVLKVAGIKLSFAATKKAS